MSWTFQNCYLSLSWLRNCFLQRSLDLVFYPNPFGSTAEPSSEEQELNRVADRFGSRSCLKSLTHSSSKAIAVYWICCLEKFDPCGGECLLGCSTIEDSMVLENTLFLGSWFAHYAVDCSMGWSSLRSMVECNIPLHSSRSWHMASSLSCKSLLLQSPMVGPFFEHRTQTGQRVHEQLLLPLKRPYVLGSAYLWHKLCMDLLLLPQRGLNEEALDSRNLARSTTYRAQFSFSGWYLRWPSLYLLASIAWFLCNRSEPMALFQTFGPNICNSGPWYLEFSAHRASSLLWVTCQRWLE